MELTHLFFLCPFMFLAGFVDAVAGGGGLISIPAYMATGMPMHFVYGCNKFSNSCGTTLATVKYFKEGALDLKVAVVSAIGSFIGAGIATKIVLLLDNDLLKKMLIIILPIMAFIILFRLNKIEIKDSEDTQKKKSLLLALLIGFICGGYDGLFGPGTGTIAIMAFALILKYEITTASGNAKLLNLMSNYASVIGYFISGSIYFQLAIPCAIFNIAGSYIGSSLAIKNGIKFIRPMMVVVVVLLLGKTILEMI